MIPRKVKTLYPKIALEEGVSLEAVTDIVAFFWRDVKRMLEEPECINVQIEGLGTFEARKKQIIYLVDKYKGLVKNMKPTTYSRYTLLDITTKKLEKLEKLLELCKLQEEKKKQIRELQKNGNI